jgi:hypothetical protein
MRYQHDESVINWIKKELVLYPGGLRAIISAQDIDCSPAFSFFPFLPSEERLKHFEWYCIEANWSEAQLRATLD